MEFNVFYTPDPVTAEGDIQLDDIADPQLDSYRNGQNGQVGVDIVVRPSDDPLSAFGDPDYYFQKKIIFQRGLR